MTLALIRKTVTAPAGPPPGAIIIDTAWLAARTAPYALDQASSYYWLDQNVTTNGTAFYMTQSGITLDLGGRTVQYGNKAPIVVPNNSFESAGMTEWVLPAQTTRKAGNFLNNEVHDGSFALEVDCSNLSAGSFTAVESAQDITLPANWWYRVGCFVYINPSTSVTATLKLSGSGVSVSALSSNVMFRGMYYLSMQVNTSGTPIIGKLSLDLSGTSTGSKFYIDNFRIDGQGFAGVVTAPGSQVTVTRYPDVPSTAAPINGTVKNGTIVEGAQTPHEGCGVVSNGYPATVDGVTITTAAIDSQCIRNQWGKLTVNNCVMRSNSKIVSSRDNFTGAVIYNIFGVGSTYTNNTILDGPHTGIFVGGTNLLIDNNTIQITSRYTNGFAILCSPSSSGSRIIRNNTIDLQSPFAGRGIGVIGSAGDNEVYGNTVYSQENGQNQEFAGWAGYAFQVEQSGTLNLDVHDNYFHGVAGTNEGFGFRINNDDASATGTIDCYNNEIRSSGGSTSIRAGCFWVRAAPGASSTVTIRDNDCFTDRIYWRSQYHSDTDVIRFLRNTWNEIAPRDTPGEAFYADSYSGAPSSQQTHGLRFTDNVYGDANSETVFETLPVHRFAPGNGLETNIDWGVDWTVTITCKDGGGSPLAGATVTIDDEFAVEVFSGITDANGQVKPELLEIEHVNDTQHNTRGPYQCQIVLAGYQTQNFQINTPTTPTAVNRTLVT